MHTCSTQAIGKACVDKLSFLISKLYTIALALGYITHLAFEGFVATGAIFCFMFVHDRS